MKVLYSILCTSMGLATLGILGCDVFVGGRAREDRVYVQAQPQYVEVQPAYVVVREAPPPVIIERRPAPVIQGQIWIDGFWNWDNQRYAWVGGRYESPPQADVVWIGPSYVRSTDGVHYTAGRWSRPASGNGNGRGRGRGN